MRHSPLRFLPLILFCSILTYFFACTNITTQDDAAQSTSANALAEEAFYQKSFEFINDYETKRYLFALNQQIQEKLSRIYSHKCVQPSNVVIADRRQPFALTTNKAQILISSGLISKLNSEDELFFVLAHENAHITNCDLRANPNRQGNLEQELNADLMASNLLVATNRPISAAYSAINRLYELQPGHGVSEHPSQTTRLKNLNQIPKNVSYRLAGANQQFLKFQLAVNQLSQFLQ